MTTPATTLTLEELRAINESSAFNAWAGFHVVSAAEGRAAIEAAIRPDLLQHAGFVHAGVIGALIDTACGYAAATRAGNVLASHYQVAFYSPAVGERMIVRAHVVKAGRRQVFAAAELFVTTGSNEKLVAGGSAVLLTV